LRVSASKIKIYGLNPTGIFQAVKNNWVLFTLWSLSLYILGLLVGPIILKEISVLLDIKF